MTKQTTYHRPHYQSPDISRYVCVKCRCW